MDLKLLLKQKDYQLLQAKRILPFKHSFTDPLINPPRPSKKKSKNNPISIQQSSKPIDPKMNILFKAPAIPRQQNSQNNNKQANQEGQSKNQATPWTSILNFFVNAYDFRKEPLEIQVANPFGSQGLKMDEQYRSTNSFQGKEAKNNISLKAYIKILENMKYDLRSKWKDNDKVGSLQIAIQSCKLLHDTSNAKFHALKFAYVIEIIEEFGLNVFKRIKTLSFPQFSQQKIDQLTIKDLEGANIPESAQQICRNWLLKISSIRQLIPRTIVQTTLLRLYFFLDNGAKAKKVLYRLSKSNRCFGEYINCIFFCTFLIRIGKQVLPHDKDFILDILDDVFFYIKQGKTKFGRQDISYDDFFVILQPFFISSFQSLAENLSQDKFKRFCSILPQNPHPVILNNFIKSFSSSLLVHYSIDITKMLQKVQGDGKYPIYKTLFQRLSGIVFSQSGQFLITAWTDLCQVKNVQILLDLLGPFTNIVFKNLPKYEKNKFFTLILERFNELFDNIRTLNKSVFTSFNNFLTTILEKTEELQDIHTLEPFLQNVAYFPNATKTEMSVNITQAFLKRDQTKITDVVVVHTIMGLMKSVPDEKKQILVLKFLDKIDFGNDLQQTLNFYGQARASFGYIEKVTINLIYKAAGLTYKARKAANGRITNKLISFLQAAISFCYITIPVLESNHQKMKLYLFLSEVSLSNNLISQATSLIKTCISQLSQAEGESDKQIYEIFFRIICFLIVMPDDPESEYLYLFNGLLQAFHKAKFKTNYEHVLHIQFYTKCIVYLSCQAQQRLPFHLEGVISNDGLFKQIGFRRALVQKIMNISDLLQEKIGKMIEINGGPQIDQYSLFHLSQCVMTLLSIFENGPRLKKIVRSIVKIIQKVKDRIFSKEQKLMLTPFKNCLNGLNQVLKENEVDVKIIV